MKIMFLTVALILGLMAAYNVGSRIGYEQGLDICTQAVQILNGTQLFTNCQLKDGKPILVIPKKGAKATFSQEVSEDGRSIHMEYSIPLTKYNIETGEQLQ